MNCDDAQTLRDMRYFTCELIKYSDVLPEDLTTMLRAYESELRESSSDRWVGIGDPIQYDCLARRIGQSITDGEWPERERLDSSTGNWYAWGETRGNVEKALRLLATRGELTLRYGMYYTRSRDEST